ncbi:MAG: protein kinase [Chloroflexi bacterium]|nr:protein kinase [Chloroflexota bacterium]
MSNEYSFGLIAKNRRRELGLTQDELARRVGCAPITLRKIEADDLRPSVQIAERIAMALNIPLEERSAFVKLARIERVFEEPHITPMPAPEEIGSEDLSGRAIRGYALGERLGSGGMGAVYRAVQPLVEREVAIKIILPMYANHPDFIRRFEAEAQLVARLEHPHIVPLYDYWREPSVAYLIMRLLRGGSVQTLLRSGTVLSSETILRMMEQIGSALSASHRAGVVHRDLKPANVLLDEDNNAYLADFGIAKNLSSPSSETQADMVIGSPDYISPEQIRSEFVRPQTDIYALGVMLYELLTGKVPFRGNTPFDVMSQHLNTPLPLLAEYRIGLPKSLDDVIEHATAKDPLQRYENVELMLNDLRSALGANLHEFKSKPVSSRPLTEMDNPYKGLRAFGEGDAQDFNGRESLIQQLLIKLGDTGELSRFLTIVGPSGSGKSSVVKAGLIPALRRGALPGSENWFIIEMMPGAHPLEELEAALLRVAVNPPASLIEQFQKDSRGLIRAVRRSLPNDPSIELVLVIDQFEEVFTLLQDETERMRFLGLLVNAILDESSRIRVILTMRADFIDRPLGYVDFGELIHQRMEIVLPLTPDELESTIASPAERVGLHLESGLVAAILHDLGDQPGTLPLLQYALTELYEKRAGNTLTRSAYLEIGGVMGALGRRAEEIFSSLDEEGQLIAKQIFLRLVTLGEGVEDTRRRVLIYELENLKFSDMDLRKVSKTFKATLDAFGNARLLSFDRDPGTRGPTVEVAHEAIIREWPRLRGWLEESRTVVRMQRQLSIAASEWMDAHRDTSFLLSGTKLAQYEGWTVSSAIALTQHEIDYLKASMTARDQREMEEATRQQRELESARKLAETESSRAELQTQSAKRLRQRAVFLTSALVLAVVFAGVAAFFGNQANKNATIAQQNEATANANEKIAVSRELAAAAISNLDADPERSILLALQAESTTHTIEAENALHRSIRSSRVIFNLNKLGPIYGYLSVNYSPDGSQIATSDSSSTARIWDAHTGNLLFYLGHTDIVKKIVYSPDGKRVSTASNNHTAKVWDAISGKEIFTLRGHTNGVNNIAFSPDGTRLVTVSNDGTAKIWDAFSGKELLTFSGHGKEVFGVAFSPDGKRVASGGNDNIVRVWDANSGQELLTLPVEIVEKNTSIYAVAFSPDGTRITAVGWGAININIWNASTGEKLFSGKIGDPGYIMDIAFSKDGRLAATGGYDQKVRVWDTTTKQVMYTLAGHTDSISGISFSPDGKSLASSSYDGTVRVWDLTTPSESLSIPFTHNPFEATLWFRTVSYSPDGTRILTNYTDNTARIWDAVSGKELKQLKVGKINNIATAYNPDGKLVASINEDNTITIWDANTGKENITLAGAKDTINKIVFSPSGTHLASANNDGSVIVWDIVSGRSLLTLGDYSLTLDVAAPAYAVAYSPDGKQIATGNRTLLAGVVIWDATTGEKLDTLDFYDPSSIDYSPDGKLLAIGGMDGTVSIWDALKGTKLWTVKNEALTIWGIKFNPEGNLLATVGFDGTTRLWDVTNGANLLTLYVDSDGATSVAFSPDGKQLAVGGKSGISIFYLQIQDVIALAKSRVTRTLTKEECRQYLHMDVCPKGP